MLENIHEQIAYQWENSNQPMENAEVLAKKNDSFHQYLFSLGPPAPAESEFNSLSTEQILQAKYINPVVCGICPPVVKQHRNTQVWGNNPDVKNVPNLVEENCGFLGMSKITSDLFMYDSKEASRDSTEGLVDKCNHSQVDSKLTSQIPDHTNSCCLNAEVLAACQTTECAKTHGEESLSRLLEKDASYRGNRTPQENQTLFLEDSFENAATNFELCQGKNFTTADEAFDGRYLDNFECSDVMTDEEYQNLENKLKFLLESDDEEELNLGRDCDGYAYFLKEMPRLFQVSDNIVPMDDSITGVWCHQTRSKEVAVRSNLSACCPSSLHAGMTLTVGQQQTQTSTMKDKEKYKPPVASTAIENVYAGIEEGESSNGLSALGFSVIRPQGMRNGPPTMESSRGDLDDSLVTKAKRSAGRGFSPLTLWPSTKVRKKLTGELATPAKTSRDPLHLSGPQGLHAAEVQPVRMESCHWNGAVLLQEQGSSVLTQTDKGTANASSQVGLFHGKGKDKSSPGEGKWTSGLSEGDQMPSENATLEAEQQDADIENTESSSNELKLFIAEPALDEILVSTSSSPIKSVSVSSKESDVEKVSGKNGFKMDNAMLESSMSHDVPCGIHECDKQNSCWDQTLEIPDMDTVASRGIRDHADAISKQEGLRDVSIPLTLSNMQTEKGKIHRTKPCEMNAAKSVCDTPFTKDLSSVPFQPSLKSAETKIRGADLPSVHEQMQKLLREEEGWGYDLICPSDEVKSLAAAIGDAAKEVETTNIAGRVSTGRHTLPGNLAGENQVDAELATALQTVMEDHSNLNSLLQTDEAQSNTAMETLETDAVVDLSAFGHKMDKPPAHLFNSELLNAETYLEDKQSETQSDNNGFVQLSAFREGKSPFGLTESPNSGLEVGQETLSGLPANSLAQLSHYFQQDVYCSAGPIVKEVDEKQAKDSHVTLGHSEVKECANFTGCLTKEGSSSRFSSKNIDPFTSEEHSSVTTVDKHTKGTKQEKRTELDLNAHSDNNCGIYCALKGDNSKDCQVVSDAQNYRDGMQEHNSGIDTDSKACRPDANCQNSQALRSSSTGEPEFKAVYQANLLTDIQLQINYKGKMGASQGRRTFRVGQSGSGPESDLEVLPADDQDQVSGKNTSLAGHFGETTKEVGMDLAGCVSESRNSTPLNSKQPSTVIRSVSNTTGQACQISSTTGSNSCVAGSQSRSQHENAYNSCLIALVADRPRIVHLTQTEPMQTESTDDEHTPRSQQDQNQKAKEEKKIQVVPCVRGKGQKEMPMASYVCDMHAPIDSEKQIHTWHERTGFQQDEHQEGKGGSQAKLSCCDRGTGDNHKSTKYDVEEGEVEPYMRALICSERMSSWHDSLDDVHPSVAPSNEQTGMHMGGLVGRCGKTSTDQAGAFIADERKNLNSSERAMVALVRLGVSPCTSGNSYHSQEKPAHGKVQPSILEATVEDSCAMKEQRRKSQEASRHCKPPPSGHSSVEEVRRMQEAIKKKLLSKVKKQRLDAQGNVCNSVSGVKKFSKADAGLTRREENREQPKPPCKKDSKAPKLLKTIQAELFPDFSGNIKLSCQFCEIHDDSTITWTKDSKLLAGGQRSAGDSCPVSLAIVQAGQKDQGLYFCCLKNKYGRATAEFNLTSEVLEHLSSLQDAEGLEEIEFLQLMFREDFICDSYFSSSLHGRITTEELHFGEGVHRKAFRSKVMQGLVPLFSPGHPCVLKVHSAIAYGTKNKDELVKKNYKLALQECYVQNTAREYAKIYASETKPLEGFGEVPEIIPIFLIHRPQNNIPYATVEEELIGEFVKYSIRDGKEINFLRRDTEAGQKCCTFQHWVYDRTSGSLLVTDMQGVGMKLTDVGIATLAKGYKGFKGNCSISFIDQFKALHQCNKYCEMLGLKPLQTSNPKQRKPAVNKGKAQPTSSSVKKAAAVGTKAGKKA